MRAVILSLLTGLMFMGANASAVSGFAPLGGGPRDFDLDSLTPASAAHLRGYIRGISGCTFQFNRCLQVFQSLSAQDRYHVERIDFSGSVATVEFDNGETVEMNVIPPVRRSSWPRPDQTYPVGRPY